MTEPRIDSEDARRAQTLPDFAVGVAIFLITVAFVVVLVPQMVLPFEDQDRAVVAERISSDLGNDLLTEPDVTSKLNESATTTFFDGNESEARERIGIDPRYSVNVTLRGAPSHGADAAVLCAADPPDSEAWIDDECEGSSDRFAIGSPVPGTDRSVGTARRTLFATDGDVVLEVRVW